MDHHVSTPGILDEVFVRSHVSRNHHRVSSVIDSEAEHIFKVGVLHPERGNARPVLLVYDSFVDILGRNATCCGEKLGMNSRRFSISAT
jgi:hypothetical protein